MAYSKNKHDILDSVIQKFELNEHDYWTFYWDDDDYYYDDSGESELDWVYKDDDSVIFKISKKGFFYTKPYEYKKNSRLINIDMSLPEDVRRNNRIDFILGLKEKNNYITTIGDYLK